MDATLQQILATLFQQSQTILQLQEYIRKLEAGEPIAQPTPIRETTA